MDWEGHKGVHSVLHGDGSTVIRSRARGAAKPELGLPLGLGTDDRKSVGSCQCQLSVVRGCKYQRLHRCEPSERGFPGWGPSRISSRQRLLKPRGRRVQEPLEIFFAAFLSGKFAEATKSQQATVAKPPGPQSVRPGRYGSEFNTFFPTSPRLRAIPPISLIMLIRCNNSVNFVRSLAPSPSSTAMSRLPYFL
jgi:hypothetical protein